MFRKNRLFWLFIIICILSSTFLYGQAKDNIDRVLIGLGSISYEKRSLLSEYGGFGSSVLVRGSGNNEAPVTFVVAVPLNAEFAVRTALSLAHKLRDVNAGGYYNADILVAFLGDEENLLPEDSGGISHKGLRDLLTLADMPENWILCYIDIDEEPEKLIIRHGISGYIAPLDIIRPLPGLFKSYALPWAFRIRHNGIYKLNLVKGPEPLFIAWDSEINGFVLSGESKHKTSSALNNKKTVSADVFSDCLLEYAALVSNSEIKGDRYYSQLTLPWGKAFFISDGLTAILLLSVMGLSLLLFLFGSARFHVILLFNIRLSIKFFWFFLILLPLMILSVRFSGLFYSLLLGLLKPAETVMSNFGAGFSILLAAFIFFLPSPLLDLIHFPRRTQFFDYAAIIFSILGLLSGAFLDFSYVPMLLWAFIFVLIGSLVKKPILVLICVLIIPVFTVDAVINIIETGSNRIAELFITTDWKNLDAWIAAYITALFTLPLLMLTRRAALLTYKTQSRGNKLVPERKYRLKMLPALVAFIMLIMTLQIILLPARDLPERKYYQAGSGKDLTLNLDSILFQDSRIITLYLEAENDPVRFDVFIESGTESTLLPVYSTPVPVSREDDGRKVIFLLGENPPNPLIMEIVVPHNFKGVLNASAVYTSVNLTSYYHFNSALIPFAEDNIL